MNLPESPVAEMVRPAAAMKFTYGSGSRPLEGYTIKRGVGRGGFGEVYFATSDAGKEVALKLIRRNLDVELRGATQCLNLKHPNLIGLYDIRTDEMCDQWIIMEYVSGESLEDAIERHPEGMPVETMLTWMRGICAGVAYLHDHGIVHRDLKPGNIFVDEGTVKIGDYGLAKFISCSRRSGQTESVGTVHYMAPEIANGRYGREIDTYALGIILFEMLTGTVPFEGESVGEVLMKHLTAEPDLTRLAEPYRDIVRRALAKDPEVRLKTVNELLAVLPGGAGATLSAFAPHSYVDAEIKLTPVEVVRPTAEAVSPKMGQASAKAGVSGGVEKEIEEPLWAMLKAGFNALQDKAGIAVEHRAPMGWALLMLFIGLSLMMGGVGQAISIFVSLGLCYAAYYVAWSVAIRPSIARQAREQRQVARHFDKSPARAAAATGAVDTPLAAKPVTAGQERAGEPPATSAAAYAAQARRRRLRASWRERVNQQIAEKPLRVKLRELVGSMFIAAVVVFVAALVAPALNFGSSATFLWLAIVGTLGAWAVMIPAKFIEGQLEDQVPMRLFMLLVGGLVGLAAFGVDQALYVDLPRVDQPFDAGTGLLSHEALRWQPVPRYTEDFRPTLSMYITFFACLLVLPRWWRQTEYTRSVRLSIWWLTASVFVAWFVHLFWWFPQPMGMLVAGSMTLAVQLASPWMRPSKRRELAEQIEQGL